MTLELKITFDIFEMLLTPFDLIDVKIDCREKINFFNLSAELLIVVVRYLFLNNRVVLLIEQKLSILWKGTTAFE